MGVKASDYLVLGSNGLVGSAICGKLQEKNYSVFCANRNHADLTNLSETEELLRGVKPRFLIMSAAKVGGVLANQQEPVDFLTENLLIQTNVLSMANKFEVERVIFLGSSCIYPKLASQPIREDSLLTGPLEPTNDAYAIAKIAGLKLVQGYRRQHQRNWISVMPTNIYGPRDNFDLERSHVIPGMLRKFHEAKTKRSPSVSLWGTGKPRREFMYSLDLADAIVFLTENYNGDSHINVGTGMDLTIAELAEMIKSIVGFDGVIEWNTALPDGTPRKLLNVDLLNSLGWKSSVSLEEGLAKTYSWFMNNQSEMRNS
jgi:GDP-L-fucose synthase